MTATATITPDPPFDPAANAVVRALRDAIVTMLATLATLACAVAIAPEPGPAVLAVVLSLSLSRSHLDRDHRGRLEAAVALPVVGLLAVGVGVLLLRAPWIGAAVFVTGMFLSIWLRRFGPLARRAGSLIALPFVTILVTPYVPARHAGTLLTLFIPVLVASLALFWVAVFHALARRLGVLPPARNVVVTHGDAPAPAASPRLVASTRMAIQMAVALAASFLTGFAFFQHRWGWIVLTAFIVNSGNRGRLDVAYKSVLRVAGAAGGTLVALLLSVQVGAHDATTVALILTAVFLGIWLRPLGYAWWALFVTIALALLQGFEGTSARSILGLRLQEILIGAAIGVAAAWLICPVRSTDVLRRRIADALAVLSDALDPATPGRTAHDFNLALTRVAQLAPAFTAVRTATRRLHSQQPADWVDALLACRAPAADLLEHGQSPGNVRKAVGHARKTLREPANLLQALHDLHHALVEAPRQSPPVTAPPTARVPP